MARKLVFAKPTSPQQNHSLSDFFHRLITGRILAFLLVIIVASAIATLIYLSRNNSTSHIVTDQPFGISHDVSDKARISPLRLHIPKLDIDAFIEPVGTDAQGDMAAPQDAQGISWYENGGIPGRPGNVVLAGHLDDAKGKPGVFAHLATLTKGDTVVVSTLSGNTYTYTVDKHATYPYDEAPLKDIFGEADVERLILITCSGTWDEDTKNYPNREVIYASR